MKSTQEIARRQLARPRVGSCDAADADSTSAPLLHAAALERRGRSDGLKRCNHASPEAQPPRFVHLRRTLDGLAAPVSGQLVPRSAASSFSKKCAVRYASGECDCKKMCDCRACSPLKNGLDSHGRTGISCRACRYKMGPKAKPGSGSQQQFTSRSLAGTPDERGTHREEAVTPTASACSGALTAPSPAASETAPVP